MHRARTSKRQHIALERAPIGRDGLAIDRSSGWPRWLGGRSVDDDRVVVNAVLALQRGLSHGAVIEPLLAEVVDTHRRISSTASPSSLSRSR